MIKKLLTYFLLPALIAVVYGVTNLPRTQTHGINYDELIYIRRTVLWEKFISGDFQNSIWQSWDAFDQPPIAPYTYGLALSDYASKYGGYAPLLQEANLTTDYYPCQDVVKSPTKTAQHYDYWACIDGKSPQELPQALSLTQELLLRTRTTTTILTGLTLGLIALIGSLAAGPLVGLIASVSIGWFTDFGTLGVMAMIDPVLYFFYGLTLLFMIRKKSILTGIFLGLAIATKFNAGSLLIVHILANLKHPKRILISGIIASIVFLTSNPFLWVNPIGNTLEMLSSRTFSFQAQQVANLNSTLTTTPARFQAITGKFGGTLVFYPLLALLISGLISAIKNPQKRILALAASTEFIALLAYLPLNWDRYFLPLFPTGSILAVIGLFGLPHALKYAWKYKKYALYPLAGAFLITHLPGFTAIEWAIVSFTTFLIFQGLISTIAMGHAFFKGNTSGTNSLPAAVHHSFSLLIPAKHEANVIGDTIAAVNRINYPASRFEALVLIPADDYDTLTAANQAIETTQSQNIRVIQLDGDTNTKAYSLNIGLHYAKNQYVGIFDAEDEPQPQILTKINQTLSQEPNLDAVQAPVQLTNLNSSWFSALNSLEYFFWFKSVLPFLSRFKSGLIAGNTVFIKKDVLTNLKGWDEHCLTEDADLGVRLHAAGHTIKFIYDPEITTYEETPQNEFAFIKQRSRWDQGFIQVIQKKDWLSAGSTRQRWLSLYVLIQPLFRHIALVNMLVIPLLTHTFAFSVSTIIAMYSWIPTYFVLIQICLYIYGLAQLTKTYRLPATVIRYFSLIFFFYPYQMMLSMGSLRAIYNIIIGKKTWYKTAHNNLHRTNLSSFRA